MIQRPRGCRDFPREQMDRRRELLAGLRDAAAGFGYGEIGLPTFEHLDLFTLKSGEDIKKQMYTFKDKGGRDLALRPEMTASAMRFYAGELQNLPKPLKLYYYGNCFRYERPQKGRFREFWQFGVEFIGSSTAAALAELVALARTMMIGSGVAGFELRIGYIDIMKTVLDSLSIPEEARASALMLIDKGNLEGLEELLYEHGAAPMQVSDITRLLEEPADTGLLSVVRNLDGEYPGLDEHVRRFDEFLRSLDMFGVAGHKVDLGIVRGLDYYTGMVFEIHVDTLGAESQICGGGEYSLVPLFGGREVSTSGFAVGFDRVMLALESQGHEFQKRNVDIFIIPVSSEELSRAAEISCQLREAGLRVDMELRGRNPKKAMKYANSSGASFAGIIGENEVRGASVMVKNMMSGEQESVAVDSLAGWLERARNRI